jgi:hypothetical protein
MKTAAGIRHWKRFARRPPWRVRKREKAIQRYAKGRGVAICETDMDEEVSGTTLKRVSIVLLAEAKDACTMCRYSRHERSDEKLKVTFE